MSHWQSERTDECDHEETEIDTVFLRSRGETVDEIPVERCSGCHQIKDLIESEDSSYMIPMGSSEGCEHKYEAVETVRFQFEYESGDKIWETITRECSDCGYIIERVNVNLVGKPKKMVV